MADTEIIGLVNKITTKSVQDEKGDNDKHIVVIKGVHGEKITIERDLNDVPNSEALQVDEKAKIKITNDQKTLID